LNSFNNILAKLNTFTKKYYSKLLIKGLLLFFSIGILFFIAILGIEYFLWLNTTGRFILFLLFIGVAFYLLYKFIAIPIFYLFKLKKGISNREASVLIGKHFPEVGDKLYNLIDLAEDENQSELLLASIAQRSESLDNIPFTNAINFKENFKYVKYLIIPLLIFGLIWLSGNLNTFFRTYNKDIFCKFFTRKWRCCFF